MLQPNSYKFVVLLDGGIRLTADMFKQHIALEAESGQEAIAACVLQSFDDGTYKITQHFSATLSLWDFAQAHRDMLAAFMRGAYLMEERV